jgi:hypothetical protein
MAEGSFYVLIRTSHPVNPPDCLRTLMANNCVYPPPPKKQERKTEMSLLHPVVRFRNRLSPAPTVELLFFRYRALFAPLII